MILSKTLALLDICITFMGFQNHSGQLIRTMLYVYRPPVLHNLIDKLVSSTNTYRLNEYKAKW